MRGVLVGLRSLVLGETWAVPAGVAITLGASLIARSALSNAAWTSVGGFLVAGLVVVTLLVSLRVGK